MTTLKISMPVSMALAVLISLGLLSTRLGEIVKGEVMCNSHTVAVAILVLMLSACGGVYTYGGKTFNNPDAAIAVQKTNLEDVLRTEVKQRNLPFAKPVRVIIPSKNLISEVGVKSDFPASIKGYRDYVATTIYNGLRSYAEGIRQKNIFERTDIEEVDSVQHITPKMGEPVIYFYIPDDFISLPSRVNSGWYYISGESKRTAIPSLGPAKVGRLATFIDKIEGLALADSPEEIASRKIIAENEISARKIIAEKLEADRRAEAERQEKSRQLLQEQRVREVDRIAREGDGSLDDLACKKRNLKPSTLAYLKCRDTLDKAREKEARAVTEKDEKNRLEEVKKEEVRLSRQRIMSGQDDRSALSDAKQKCIDLGFKPATEKFGKCVLQLSK